MSDLKPMPLTPMLCNLPCTRSMSSGLNGEHHREQKKRKRLRRQKQSMPNKQKRVIYTFVFKN